MNQFRNNIKVNSCNVTPADFEGRLYCEGFTPPDCVPGLACHLSEPKLVSEPGDWVGYGEVKPDGAEGRRWGVGWKDGSGSGREREMERREGGRWVERQTGGTYGSAVRRQAEPDWGGAAQVSANKRSRRRRRQGKLYKAFPGTAHYFPIQISPHWF